MIDNAAEGSTIAAPALTQADASAEGLGASKPAKSKADMSSIDDAVEAGTVAAIMEAARESGNFGSDVAIYAEFIRHLDQLKRTERSLKPSTKGCIKRLRRPLRMHSTSHYPQLIAGQQS